MRPRDLASTFVTHTCTLGSVHQYLSTSCAFVGTSVNCLCIRGTFRLFPSTIWAVGRPLVNFCQLSVWLGGIPSTSDNFPYGRQMFVNFRQLSVLPRDLPSTSVNFSCVCKSFCQISLIFRASLGPSMYCPWNFRVSKKPFVKFPHPSMCL